MDADEFERHRPRLFGIAYRMLGERAAAEDAVQEAFVRASKRETGELESPRAWLGTVVTRLCLDQLESARARRERYVGPWLPEPLLTEEAPDPLSTRETLSMAFLVLLETLSPVERAVFLLHEVFDYRHAEVAVIVGKEEAATRQILHRAKARVVAGRPRFSATAEQHERLLLGFIEACAAGDVARLERILADDVVVTSDGGGRRRAALKPVRGASQAARMLVGLTKKGAAGLTIDLQRINGETAIVSRAGEAVDSVVTIAACAGAITQVHIVRNPDKLTHL